MTRINVGINPKQLTDEHLRAEYREIQRLPSNYRASVRSGSINRLPKQFTLGKGHVLFFMDKFEYWAKRVCRLHSEVFMRGFKPAFRLTQEDWGCIPLRHQKDYTPTTHDRQLLIERITERITNSPKKHWHYYGKRITPAEAIELLTKNE